MSIIRSVDLIYVMKDKDHIPSLLGRHKTSNKVFCVYAGLHFTHKHEGPTSYKIFSPLSSVQRFRHHRKECFLAFLPNLNSFWFSPYTI